MPSTTEAVLLDANVLIVLSVICNQQATMPHRAWRYGADVLSHRDPLTIALAEAVRAGSVDALEALLAAHPSLAQERFGDASESRTALHVVTDWPAKHPRIDETIELLAAAGAPVDGRFVGAHRETPLHWAASADDVVAIDALLDAGADIEATGAIFTDGTPLSDGVVFAQWNAARRLVQRGARMTIWQGAALGEMDALTEQLTETDAASEITNACWHACRAGQLSAAQLLVERGADLDVPGHDDLTARQAGSASGNPALVAWLADRRLAP